MLARITLAVALAFCSCLAAQDPHPGQKTIDRAAKDSAKLLPQTGLGGDESGKVTPNKTTFETVTIDVEGCEKMEGYIALPEDLDAEKKYALMFVFHGNGDRGEGRVKNVSRITSERDPVITIGVQYQELTEDGKGKMGLPTLATSDKIIEGSKWLLQKVMKDHPVDLNRVFVGGFSWGTSWASGWACKEWRDDPTNYPFRAMFLYGSAGGGTEETWPPIPTICTVGEKETAVLGRINVVANVRQFCNALASWGKPVQYHEIPGMGHSVNGRCHQITRDTINELGGPGMVEYETGDESAKLPPLPFKENEDPYVREVISLCESDDWAGALARVEEVEDDKEIPSKQKREIKHYDKDIEKVAKKVIKDVHEQIEDAIKDEKMPNPALIRRLRAIVDTWPEESWIEGKGYNETLSFLETDFAPAKREREREQLMKDALALEAEDGERSEAKAKYEELAKRSEEDEGRSIWPKAAAYRLTWWVDGKE